ncbi:GtrA family protein [Dongia sp.]|uniref:GtrA family protein n=1 Tax=Dongia sp. TaxID=1977262 RepID=UPI0035B010E5
MRAKLRAGIDQTRSAWNRDGVAAILSLPIVKRALRFGTTGVMLTFLHAAVATGLIEGVALNPVAANIIAFIFATLVSYLVNTYWSFSQRPDAGSLVRFVIVALCGLTATACVSGFAEWLGLPYWIGIMGVVVTVPLITFPLHAFWTYRK